MLLIIHNLPTGTKYGDVKELLVSKCGLKDCIVDNLQYDNGNLRVTVGVMEEEDAALLVRKVNGLFYKGQQLYVENKRQKKESDQPYRVNIPQAQNMEMPQVPFDYNQMQGITPWAANPMAFMYQSQALQSGQNVQNPYLMYGQYPKMVMSQNSGPTNNNGQQGGFKQQGYDQQGYGDQGIKQQGYDQQRFKQQGIKQQGYDQQGFKQQGYDQQGFKQQGPGQQGLKQQGYDQQGLKQQGYYQQGFKQQGNDQQGFKQQGYDQQGFKQQGHNQQGLKQEGYGQKGYKEQGQNQLGYKEQGYQQQGREEQGYGGGLGENLYARRKVAGSRWEESRPSRDERHRSPSPPVSSPRWHDPPESKRPKWEPGLERSDRRFSQDRPRAEWGSSRDSRPDTSRQLGLGQAGGLGRPAERGRRLERDRHDRSDGRQSDRREPDRREPDRREPDRRGPDRREPDRRRPDRQGYPDHRNQPYRQDVPDRRSEPVRREPPRPAPIKTYDPQKLALKELKLNKVKAMRVIMYDTIKNLLSQKGLEGPSAAKTALRKVVMARLDEVVVKPDMALPAMVEEYRRKYPETGDNETHQQVLQKIRAGGKVTQPALSAALSIAELDELINKPFSTNKEYRACTNALINRILYDTADNLKNDNMLKNGQLLTTIVRKSIRARVGALLRQMVPPRKVLEKYREEYPYNTDLEMLATIEKKMTEKQLKPENMNEFTHSFAPGWYPLNDNVYKSIPKPENVIGTTPKPQNVVKATAAPRPTQPTQAPQGKIPNYPEGDKKKHVTQKNQYKQELQGLVKYDMEDIFQKVMDEEIDAIGRLIEKVFNEPVDESEESIYKNVDKEDCIAHCKKFLSFHISKRITDEGLKLVRIYGHPKPPRRNDLQEYLKQFNCLTLKKSVKAPFYTASFGTHTTVDYLCNRSPFIMPDNTTITFKQMHVAPKKPRKGAQHWVNLRKQLTNRLIEKSNVNLLDKDWPAQEEAEKIAKAEKEAELKAVEEKAKETIDENDDVIHVEDEIKTVDITDDDHEKKDDSEQFLNENFKVIDEIRASDDESKEKVKENIAVVDDDWDQNGDDWNEVENDENAGDMVVNEDDITMSKIENEADDITIAKDENEAGDITVAKDENEADESANDGNAENGDDNILGDDTGHNEEMDDDEEIGENVEDIDIADVDWDNIDEDDLEDY